MRFLRLLLIVISLILPSVRLAAQTPQQITAAQLKEEIQKLLVVERDGNMSAEVRELNRIFLKKRRIQLQDLLQKNVEGLKKYLATLEASLSPEEKLIVQNTITNTEKELQALTEDIQGRSSGVIAAKTASMPDTNAAADSGSSTVGGGNGNGNGNGNGHSNGANVPVVSSPSIATPGTAVNQPVVQPQGSTSFNAALNARIKEKVEALSRNRVEQTDNTNQTDVPSASGSSGSLVDQSSASDLIGLAANFAGLSASSNDQEEPSSIAVTTSAYSLLAAIKRVDPLNSVFYDKHRNWRKFAVTLGYDDEDQPDGTKQRAKIFGAKFMFIDRRDPTLERNAGQIKIIGDKLQDASNAFGNLSLRASFFVISLDSVRRNIVNTEFKAFLQKELPEAELALQQGQKDLANPPADLTADERQKLPDVVKRRQATVDRIRQLLDEYDRRIGNLFTLGANSLPAGWSREELAYQVAFADKYLGADYRQKLGEDVSKAIDEFIDLQLTEPQLLVFKNLDDSARAALEDIRHAPQFSLAFTTKQRRIGIDEYLGTLVFDYGVADRINLTLNGSYNYLDSKLVGADLRGFKFAGQLRFQLNGENLLGKKPLFFDVSTSGSWMNNVDAIYKAQGKLTIPIADGIDFPISVTWANKTALIDEKEVRGQFGFTLDTARLIRAFLFR